MVSIVILSILVGLFFGSIGTMMILEPRFKEMEKKIEEIFNKKA